MTIDKDFETVRESFALGEDRALLGEALARIEARIAELEAEAKAHPYGPRWADLEAENAELLEAVKGWHAWVETAEARVRELELRDLRTLKLVADLDNRIAEPWGMKHELRRD